MKKRISITSILLILFIAITVLIKTDIIVPFDDVIYKLVTFKMNDIITSIFKVFTFLGSTGFIIFLCVFFLVLSIILKKKNVGLIIDGVVIISTIVNNVVKVIIRRARPTVLALVTEKSFSFPSGHTMASTTMYGILLYLVLKSDMKKSYKVTLSIILGILPILVMLSRIYLGAHFASDVIGGYILSVAMLLIETYFIDKKKWI